MTISDIVNKTYFYTKTNATSYPNANMLLAVNTAYDRAVSLIHRADGRWQFDDSNNPATDQGDGTGGAPFATTALVANQQDYAFATTHLESTRLEVLDENDNWRLLTPIDQNDIKGVALPEYLKTPGTPIQYDKLGPSIQLYPPASYAKNAALRVYFKRGPVYYTSTQIWSDGTTLNGTKKPGFNALYHELISLWASYDYAFANGLPNANQIMDKIMKMEDALQEEYSKRSGDEQKIIRPVMRSSR